RFRPFLIVLLILTVADAVQTALTRGFAPLPTSLPVHSAPAPSGLLLSLNFYLMLPVGRCLVVIFDLLMITASAEHLRRHRLAFLITHLPGVGFLPVDGAVWATRRGGWPLIPLITAGWLCGEAVAPPGSRHPALVAPA